MTMIRFLIVIVNYRRIIEMKIFTNPVWTIGEDMDDRVVYPFGNVGDGRIIKCLSENREAFGSPSQIVSPSDMECHGVFAGDPVQRVPVQGVWNGAEYEFVAYLVHYVGKVGL